MRLLAVVTTTNALPQHVWGRLAPALDRTFAMTAEQELLLVPGRNGMFRRSVVVDGAVVGFWRRAGRPTRRTLEVEEFAPLPRTVHARLEKLFAAPRPDQDGYPAPSRRRGCGRRPAIERGVSGQWLASQLSCFHVCTLPPPSWPLYG